MIRKMFTLLAAALITVCLAGNAMAVAFGHGHFIRVVYDSVGSKEYATDLGDWASVSAAAATGNVPVGGGTDAITPASTGAASLANLYVAYYIEDPTTGANQVAIAGDANGLTSGARKFNGISNGLFLASGNYLLNMVPGTNSALLPDKTASNTFFNRGGNAVIGAGDYAGWVTAATNPGGVLSLAAFSTIGYVDQTIYYWSGANLQSPGTRMVGVKVFTVRTMADGSTIINPSVAADTVPPTLTVTAPVDGLVTNYATLAVTGTAIDTGSGLKSVTVNDQAATVDAGGFFSFSVTLIAGSNPITVVAMDNAGNSTPPVTRTVTLDLVPPVLTVAVRVDGVATNNNTFTFTGTVMDAGSGIKSLTVNDHPVPVVAGAFSANVPLVLGPNTITVVATDNAGNNSAPVIRTVTLDTVAPILTVTTPVDGFVTNNATLAVTGTATDPGSGIKTLTVNGLSVPVVAGAFSTNVTLVAGTNPITVVVTDNVGNTTTVTRSVSLDMIAPVLTVTAPVDKLATNNATLAVTGTATDVGSGIKTVTVNGSPVTMGVGGSFNSNVTLAAGTNTITMIATDTAGNITTVIRLVTQDQAGPVLTVSAPVNGFITNNASLAVTGTATAGSGIKTLTVNGSPVSVVAGAFSTNVTLVAGTNTITVVATDNAGNSTPPVTRSVTLDQDAPVLMVTAPVDKLATNNATLTVTGTVTDAGSGIKTVTVNGSPVTIGAGGGSFSVNVTLVVGSNPITVVATDNAGNTTTVTRTITFNPSPLVLTVSTLAYGSFTNNATLNITGTATDSVSVIKSVTVNGQPVTFDANGAFSTAVTLAVGPNEITVVATDDAGITATDGPRTITYDPNAPVVNVTTPDDNSFSNVSPLTISGAINETAGVTVAVNGGAPQAAVITGMTFTASVILAPGLNHIDIVGTDVAGNLGYAKRAVTYVPNAPNLAITDPAQDITTSLGSLTIKGTVSDAQTAVTLTLTVDGQTYTPTVTNGVFSQDLTFTTEKTYNVVVTATDQAGNLATVQRNIIYAVILDKEPPVLTVTAPVDNLTTGNSTLAVTGAATDAGSGIKTVTVNGQAVTVDADGAFSTNVSLVAGINTITVIATDNAGNSTAPVIRTVTLNQGVPVLTVTAPVDGSTTSSATLAVTGIATASSGLKSVTVNGTAVTVGADGVFTSNVTLVAGTNTITVVATNDAGITTTDGPRTITYDPNAPVVTVMKPDDNSFSNVSPLTISGAINETAGVTVAVNGGSPQAAVITGMTFTASVILMPGLNHIDILGSDVAGNLGYAKRTVTYAPNAPKLAITDPAQDITTSLSSLTIKGTVADAQTAVTLTLTVDGRVYTPTVTNGAFSQDITFTTEKTYNVVVIATDQAGNLATVQRNVIYLVNQIPPVLTVSTLANGSFTNNATLNISGTVKGAVSSIKSVTVNGQAVPVDAGGAFSTAVTLIAGPNTITLVATNDAGITTTDGPRSITYDPNAPVVTVATPDDNSYSNVSPLTISGAINETAAVTVAVNGGAPQAAVITGATFAASFILTPGINTLTIVGADQAGNLGTAKRTVTYDPDKPNLAITDPPQDLTTSQSSLTIKGTVSDAQTAVTLVLAVDGQTYTPAVTDGSFSQLITFTSGKTCNVVVIAIDQAGNSATAQRNIIHAVSVAKIPGDADNDGVVTVYDVRLTLEYAVGLIPHTPENDAKYLATADVAPLNALTGKPMGDGVVNVFDALTVLRKVVGLDRW